MRLITLLSLLFIFISNVSGQSKDLKKANQLFKEDKYALAIPYYKKALTSKKNLSIKSKLAFCYKITNQIEEATKLYEEIVTNERAKTKSYYYYAETLMSNGRYDEAKNWFKKYAAIETDDETVDRMIASCDFAKTVPAYFGQAMIISFTENSEQDDNAPVFWDNGIVFTSDRKGKLKFLDTKSGATARNYLRLYHSELRPDGTFSPAKEYISKINDARKNTGMATFQPTGTSMVFTRNGNHLNKQNAYCLQLYQAKSSNGENWEKAELLNFCRTASNYMHPSLSADGKTLFFVSDKAGGLGGTDIYVSKKEKNKWSRPKNLGATINTNGHEGFPFIHPNGKLYFCSKGHLGVGGFDIFVTQKDKNGEWEIPTNLGAPINSPTDDISIFISKNEEMGLFTSSREGGDDDIFLVSFNPEVANMNQTILTSVSTKEEKIVSLNKVVETTPINQPTLEEKMAEQKESQPTTSEEEKIVSLNKVVETTPINQPTVDEKMAEQKESQSTTSEEEKITPLTKVVETTPINQPTVDEKMAEQKENQSTTSKEEKIIPPARVAVTRPINQPTLAEKNRAQQENQPVINKEEKEVIIERKVFLEQFDVEGTKVEKNKIYTVPNIQFFEGEYFVTYKIAKELDLIAALLKKHQTLKIEIASHTANLSSFEEKISLTQKRADAILDYLGRKGIDASSVQGKGYGGQQPLNNCLMDIDCSVEEHTINDRVEVKVIEK